MSGKPSRDRGIRWERDVSTFLGLPTTRSLRPGVHDDGGDIAADGWFLECKDHGRLRLPKWWDEMEAKLNPGQRPALIVKRRRHPTRAGFVYLAREDIGLPADRVMTLGEFRALLARQGAA